MTKQILVAMMLISLSFPASSADKKIAVSLADGVEAYSKSKFFTPNIDLFFGDQQHPEVIESIESHSITLRSSRSFAKKGYGVIESLSEEELQRNRDKICHYIFTAVVNKLKIHAQKIGADAIVGIIGDWKSIPFISNSEYQCVKGGFHTAVALKGEFIKYK